MKFKVKNKMTLMEKAVIGVVIFLIVMLSVVVTANKEAREKVVDEAGLVEKCLNGKTFKIKGQSYNCNKIEKRKRI